MTAALPQPDKDSDWTTETLRQFMVAMFDAIDRRYAERFTANQKTLDDLLAASQLIHEEMANVSATREQVAELQGRLESLKELTEAKFVTFRVLIDSQAEKVALALASSDKAVGKAETANERRFEGVNEFREQLRDQALGFMPRRESEQRWMANAERIDKLNQDLRALASRLDLSAGQDTGHTESTKSLATIAGLGFALLSVVVVVIGIILANR